MDDEQARRFTVYIPAHDNFPDEVIGHRSLLSEAEQLLLSHNRHAAPPFVAVIRQNARTVGDGQAR